MEDYYINLINQKIKINNSIQIVNAKKINLYNLNGKLVETPYFQTVKQKNYILT
jgi:hypothetical protein